MPISNPPTGLGYAQNWASQARAFATQYTNNTGKPIAVSVLNTGAGAGTLSTTIIVNGVNMGTTVVAAATAGYVTRDTFIVPPGHTYQVNGNVLGGWFELS